MPPLRIRKREKDDKENISMKIIAMLMILLLLLTVMIPKAKADIGEGGVWVENIPPFFSSLIIEHHEGEISVSLNASDLNSYRDIRYIFVNITKESAITSSIGYITDRNNTEIGVLNNIIGDNLIDSESYIDYGIGTGLERCFLDIKIHFKSVEGNNFELKIIDRNNLSAAYLAPLTQMLISQENSNNILLFIFVFSLISTGIIQVSRKRRGVSYE